MSELRYDRTYRSKETLREKMSEIISLRERVAQAELATLKLAIGDAGSSDKRHRQVKDQS
jgi:hypothetical protein